MAAAGAVAFIWGTPPLPCLRWRAMRDLLGYAGAYSLANISWVGFANCDYAIIAASVSPLAAGFYFRAYSTGVQYQNKIGQVMTSVAFPVLPARRRRRTWMPSAAACRKCSR